MPEGRVTPAMKQYFRFKKQHPDCVLFFRMGDFYEMFYDDATLAHKVLGVTLTQRTEGVPMAGVPYHAVEGYLRRMIQAGHRVAVCEQVEDPKQAKGVVERDVTQVVTPGTLTDEHLLDEGQPNRLAAMAFVDAGDDPSANVAIAWAELSTGSVELALVQRQDLVDELARISPSELVFAQTADGESPDRSKAVANAIATSPCPRPAWTFRHDEAFEIAYKQYAVATLDGFGLSRDDDALPALGALLHYLCETQRTTDTGRLSHLRPPKRHSRTESMVIDQTSLISLEILRTVRTGQTQGSLIGIYDQTATAMGKRLLRQWLTYPLSDRDQIEARQKAVGELLDDQNCREALIKLLRSMHDVERITGRLAIGRATPRDLWAVGQSAGLASELLQLLEQRPALEPWCGELEHVNNTLGDLADTLQQACVESPPAHLREGGLIRDGYDSKLDHFHNLERDSDQWLANYQKQLAEQIDVPSLKVGYNKVFGYYIELTAAHRDKAPDDWTRKQTLKNAERFITSELKTFESEALSAQTQAIEREQQLFAELCAKAHDQIEALHVLAGAASALDVLACFAAVASKRRHVQPTIEDEPVLDIQGGRHPVLDVMLGQQFVPNDVTLGHDATLALITGPNMAGKSTYIRQTALIVLLAHTGAFVPADSATIGLCDRIFTRIGASDELHAGQSTFMVEMTETANLCHHATEHSLVILDEIGRGTSTLDGLALAWAITEHLAARRCRCLFATHYHELTSLAQQHRAIANLNVTVREWQDQVVFLHRIVPGATNKSYGIHVARIAGLGTSILDRANAVLEQLSVSHQPPELSPGPASNSSPEQNTIEQSGSDQEDPNQQMSLFTQYVEHPAVDMLRNATLESMSPLEAFDLLRKLKAELDDK